MSDESENPTPEDKRPSKHTSSVEIPEEFRPSKHTSSIPLKKETVRVMLRAADAPRPPAAMSGAAPQVLAPPTGGASTSSLSQTSLTPVLGELEGDPRKDSQSLSPATGAPAAPPSPLGGGAPPLTPPPAPAPTIPLKTAPLMTPGAPTAGGAPRPPAPAPTIPLSSAGAPAAARPAPAPTIQLQTPVAGRPAPTVALKTPGAPSTVGLPGGAKPSGLPQATVQMSAPTQAATTPVGTSSPAAATMYSGAAEEEEVEGGDGVTKTLAIVGAAAAAVVLYFQSAIIGLWDGWSKLF